MALRKNQEGTVTGTALQLTDQLFFTALKVLPHRYTLRTAFGQRGGHGCVMRRALTSRRNFMKRTLIAVALAGSFGSVFAQGTPTAPAQAPQAAKSEVQQDRQKL